MTVSQRAITSNGVFKHGHVALLRIPTVEDCLSKTGTRPEKQNEIQKMPGGAIIHDQLGSCQYIIERNYTVLKSRVYTNKHVL